MEPFYPLHVRICRECLLVQLPAYVAREDIFREYAYFSSFSDSWVEHARRYVDTMIERREPGPGRASSSRWPATTATSSGTSSPAAIPVLGVEPARNVAAAARGARASRR